MADILAFPGGRSPRSLPQPQAQPQPRLSCGPAAGRRSAVTGYYAGFPERWRVFLRAHFSGPTEAAAYFAVCERAAGKWWDGIGGVRGDKIAFALETIPGAAAWLCPGQLAAAA